MAYGTALASFNVEEFGTDRVARLEADELHERVADLQQMTSLEPTREEELQPMTSFAHTSTCSRPSR